MTPLTGSHLLLIEVLATVLVTAGATFFTTKHDNVGECN